MDGTRWWQRAIGGLFSRSQKRTAEEVVSYLSNFIEDGGGPSDWDDFTSVDIDDPDLDALRARAANIELPVGTGDKATLRQILADAQRLQQERSS